MSKGTKGLRLELKNEFLNVELMNKFKFFQIYGLLYFSFQWRIIEGDELKSLEPNQIMSTNRHHSYLQFYKVL